MILRKAQKAGSKTATWTSCTLYKTGSTWYTRKANRSDVIPVPDFISSSALEMSVSIAFERHTNKMQSAGMVCMVSAAGFYVLEINEKKQYRMWVKANNEQLLLTDGDKPGLEKKRGTVSGQTR
jgi:hypothetical protein